MSSSPTFISRVGYSADVRMSLEIEGRHLAVAQVGPDFIILAGAGEMPPSTGDLVVVIDGNERRRTLALPDGIRAGRLKTPIASSSE